MLKLFGGKSIFQMCNYKIIQLLCPFNHDRLYPFSFLNTARTSFNLN